MATLAELNLWSMSRLESLDDLRGLVGLKRLTVSPCAALRDVRALSTLTSLEQLTLMNCKALVDLSPVAELPNLSSLTLWGHKRFEGRFLSREAVQELEQRLRADGSEAVCDVARTGAGW